MSKEGKIKSDRNVAKCNSGKTGLVYQKLESLEKIEEYDIVFKFF